jgi:hypothetical protein
LLLYLKFSSILLEGFVKPSILRKRGGREARSSIFLGKRPLDQSFLALRRSREPRLYNKRRMQRYSKRRINRLRKGFSKLLGSRRKSRRKLNGLLGGRIVVERRRKQRPGKQ